jgi:hypothetical protein
MDTPEITLPAFVLPDMPLETPPLAAEPETLPELPESTLILADAQPARRTQPKPFYVASQWHILPGELDGYIEAVNNTTGDRYEGTIADFNDMLKGN